MAVLEQMYVEYSLNLYAAKLSHQMPRVKLVDYDARLGSGRVDAALYARKVEKDGVYVFLPGRKLWTADRWLQTMARCRLWPKCAQEGCECAREREAIQEEGHTSSGQSTLAVI